MGIQHRKGICRRAASKCVLALLFPLPILIYYTRTTPRLYVGAPNVLIDKLVMVDVLLFF